MLKYHNYHYFCVEMAFRTLKCLNIGTPKNINFPLGTNGNSMVLLVPIFKHFRVIHCV